MTDLPNGKASLRRTNRNLYLSVTTLGIISVALGLNFVFTVPTFEQFGISRFVIGVGFLALGAGIIFHLNAFRSLKMVRVLLIANAAYMAFWGIGTSQTFFEGKSSLQLFILYWGLALLQVPLVLQPSFFGVNGEKK